MIGKTNAIGINNSDASLNFSVVASEIRPVGKENLIWLNTPVEIAGWVFQSEAPTNVPQNTVWIKIGTSSTVAFNAVKGDNVLKVYPIQCKLYDGSIWNDIEAEIYQNGWKSWGIIVFIPDSSHQNTFTTKAVAKLIDRADGGRTPSTTYNIGQAINVSLQNEQWGGGNTNYREVSGMLVTGSAIDVTNYEKVIISYSNYTHQNSGDGVYLFVSSASNDFNTNVGTLDTYIPASALSSSDPSTIYEAELSVSTMTGNKYVGAHLYVQGNALHTTTINISQIKLQ